MALNIPVKAAGQSLTHEEFNQVVSAVNDLTLGGGLIATYDTVGDLPASITGQTAKLVFVRSNVNLEPDAYILFGNKKYILTLIPQQ